MSDPAPSVEARMPAERREPAAAELHRRPGEDLNRIRRGSGQEVVAFALDREAVKRAVKSVAAGDRAGTWRGVG